MSKNKNKNKAYSGDELADNNVVNNPTQDDEDVTTENMDDTEDILSFDGFSSLISLYEELSSETGKVDESLITVKLLSWINSVLMFDPFSDKALSLSVDDFIKRISEVNKEKENPVIRDFLYHLIEFTGRELSYLFCNLREKILRKHESMPLYSVRETDSKTIQILARKPGRTVNEKLSNQPTMVAVKRRFSTDTLENQLLKLFVLKVNDLLQIRKNSLEAAGLSSDDIATDFISKINFWRNSDEASAIGPWKNTPPNNVLLQDRRYHKIWLGWHNLRNADDFIKDFTHKIENHLTDYIFWNLAYDFASRQNVRMYQTPVVFSEDTNNRFCRKEKFICEIFSKDSAEPSTVTCVKDLNKITVSNSEKKYSFMFSESSVSIVYNDGEPNIGAISEHEIWDFSEIVARIFAGESETEIKRIPEAIIGNKAAVDLSYTYPTYYDGRKSGKLLERIMLQQWASVHDESSYYLDNTSSKGIVLKDPDYKINVYTLRSIVSASGSTSQNDKFKRINASVYLFNIMKRYLNVDKLVYAVPDGLDDFDAEPLRIGVNSAYNASSPIPVSICCCEHGRLEGNLDHLGKTDLIIVIDTFKNGISLTPIQCDYDEILLREAPETKGIQFVRYPTEYIKYDNYLENNTYIENCSTNLKGRLFSAFGYDGVDYNLNNTSYILDEHEHPEMKKKARHGSILITREHIKTITESLGKSLKYNELHIISNKPFIKPDDELKNSTHFIQYDNIAEAAYITNEVEAKLRDSAFWFDFLPDLNMEAVVNGQKKLLNLVKNKKIKPKLNVAVPIVITWNFILPAKKQFYHFPLIKGHNSNKAKQKNDDASYEAYIESDMFPLNDNCDCSLELTYTYGAENPYKLAFVPKNFSNVKFRVQWKLKSEIPVDYDTLPVPPYPAQKSEEYYRHYPKKNSSNNETSDLMDWFSTNLDYLSNLRCLGPCVYKSSETFTNKYNKEVTVYKFADKNGLEVKYFQLKKEDLSFEINEKKNLYADIKGVSMITDIRKKIRFPMIALFNEGLKIDEFNNFFHKQCRNFINFVADALKNNSFSDELNNECVYLVCSMTDDIPDNIIKYITSKKFIHDCYFEDRVLAKALHDCKLPWQTSILNKMIKNIKTDFDPSDSSDARKSNHRILRILSSAIWRDGNFVNVLSAEDIQKLAELCHMYLSGTSRKFFVPALELLLGLMRSRKHKNVNITKILAPDSKLNRSILNVLNELKNKCIKNNNIKLNTFLEISVCNDKVPQQNVPPILNACIAFLECIDETDSIQITGMDLDDSD